jgi:hypothetical protein
MGRRGCAGELLLVVFPGDRSLIQPVKVRPKPSTSLGSREVVKSSACEVAIHSLAV